MLLMALSFIGDFLWMCYWIPFWRSAEQAKWQTGVHTLVIFASFINWVLKLAVLVMLGFTKQEDLKNAAGRLNNLRAK